MLSQFQHASLVCRCLSEMLDHQNFVSYVMPHLTNVYMSNPSDAKSHTDRTYDQEEALHKI